MAALRPVVAADGPDHGGGPDGFAADHKAPEAIGDPAQFSQLTAYQLLADSPMIDQALDLDSQFGIDPGSRDFYGNSLPYGPAYDVGAHQVVPEPSSIVMLVDLGLTCLAGYGWRQWRRWRRL